MTTLILAAALSLPTGCGHGHGFHPFRAAGRALFGPRAAYRAQACGGAGLYASVPVPPRAAVPSPQAPACVAGPCPGGVCVRP